MKQFNLEAALAGKPVVTRDGRKVSDIRYFPSAKDGNKVGFVLNGSIYARPESGEFGNSSPADLFMAIEKKTGYVAIFNDRSMGQSINQASDVYATKEMCRRCNPDAMAYVPVEWEE